MDQKQRAIWALVAVAVVWSMSSAAIKGVAADPWVIVGIRSAFTGCSLLVLGQNTSFSARKFVRSITADYLFGIAMVAMIVSMLSMVVALKLGAIVTASVLCYTGPFWRALFGKLFFRERISATAMLAVIGTPIGVGCVLLDGNFETNLLSSAAGLISGATWALANVCLEYYQSAQSKNGNNESASLMENVIGSHLLTALIGGGIALSCGSSVSTSEVPALLLVCSTHVIGFALYVWAIRYVSTLRAMILGSTQPVLFTPLFAFILCSEIPTLGIILGAIVITSSGLIPAFRTSMLEANL